MNEEKDTSQEDKRDWFDPLVEKYLELEKRIEVLEKATAGTMATNDLLKEILDQQKRQTYLLALIKFDSYEQAANYMNGKELFIPSHCVK